MWPISILFKSISNSHCLQNGIEIFLSWHKLTRILLLDTNPTSSFLISPRIPIFWPKRTTCESSNTVLSHSWVSFQTLLPLLISWKKFLACSATRYPSRLSQCLFSEKPSLTENPPTLLLPLQTHTHTHTHTHTVY